MIKLYKIERLATAMFTPKTSDGTLVANIAIIPTIVENPPVSKMVISISFTASKQCCTFSLEAVGLFEIYNTKEPPFYCAYFFLL